MMLNLSKFDKIVIGIVVVASVFAVSTSAVSHSNTVTLTATPIQTPANNTATLIAQKNLTAAIAKLGSIGDGQAYTSTTTKQVNGTALPTVSTFKPYGGVLGSVIVEGATAGQQINIYDATTSDATQRKNTATTTLVSIPSTTLAGTYTFDESFVYGLLVEVIGATGTSTITWR